MMYGIVAALLLRRVTLLLFLWVVIDIWRTIWAQENNRERWVWEREKEETCKRAVHSELTDYSHISKLLTHRSSWLWVPRDRWADWTANKLWSRPPGRTLLSADCANPEPERPPSGAASPDNTNNHRLANQPMKHKELQLICVGLPQPCWWGRARGFCSPGWFCSCISSSSAAWSEACWRLVSGSEDTEKQQHFWVFDLRNMDMILLERSFGHPPVRRRWAAGLFPFGRSMATGFHWNEGYALSPERETESKRGQMVNKHH